MNFMEIYFAAVRYYKISILPVMKLLPLEAVWQCASRVCIRCSNRFLRQSAPIKSHRETLERNKRA